MSEERFGRIEKTLEGFRQRFDGIDRRLDGVDRRLGEFAQDVDRRFDELGRHMRVLHEEVIGRIQAIADPAQMLRREFKAADAEVLETVTRRLDPLELTVRDHSAQLAKRKRR